MTPPAIPPQPTPAPKKTSPLVWILGGLAVVFVLFGLMIAAGGYFAYRAIKNAGFDPDLMQRNPGLAMAKMVTAINPEVDVISTNESKGTITVKEKSTGKILVFRFDPDKKTMVITDEKGDEVRVSASGSGVEVKAPDGSMQLTGTNKAPAWVPVYPGSSPEGSMSIQNAEGSSTTFGFQIADPPSKVLEHYQTSLKSAGFTIQMTATSDGGGMISAEDQGKKRNLTVTVSKSGDETQVGIIALEKK